MGTWTLRVLRLLSSCDLGEADEDAERYMHPGRTHLELPGLKGPSIIMVYTYRVFWGSKYIP